MPRIGNPFAGTSFDLEGGPTPTPVPGQRPTTPMPGAGYGTGDLPGGFASPAAPPDGEGEPQPMLPGSNAYVDLTVTDPLAKKYNEALHRMNSAMGQLARTESVYGETKVIKNPAAEASFKSASDDADFYRDQMQKEVDYKQKRADTLEDRGEARRAAAEVRSASIALHQMDQEFQRLRDRAQESFKREEWGVEAGEAEKTRGFQAGEGEKARGFQREEREGGEAFSAAENSLDREIRRQGNEIALGNLNLNSALGQLQKFLEAQQYTIPEGAQYVPGFQPGGAVQEASRLAGVSYNPAGHRANPQPFDPAALVRQTLGR